MAYPSHSMKSLAWPILSSVRHLQCSSTTVFSNYRESVIQRIFKPLGSLNYARLHHLKPISSVGKLYEICESHRAEVDPRLVEKPAMDEDIEVESFSVSDRSLSNTNSKEEQRRRKIGLANKGKVPWNKGRQHSKETRLRIKQRTIEALRNPEVRKKMSEHPQLHSDETKEKIRSSVKRVWAKRSKWKQLKEKFISSWSENIAEAAMKGGHGQQKLDWDSYDRIKEELVFRQLQMTVEKGRAKELAKLKAERAAEARAEKERLAERNKKHKEKAERESKTVKSEHKEQSVAEASKLKLKQRLTKIHKKKTKHGRVAVGRERVAKWEKLDIEMIKKEGLRREISLADQIRAAKSRRADEALSTCSTASVK